MPKRTTVSVGQRYGNLVVEDRVHHETRNGLGRLMWLCRCDCGGTHHVESSNLTSGNTRWCRECSKRHKSSYKTAHGQTRGASPSKAYYTWKGMKQRVFDASNKRYSEYGGRGIDMDPRWAESFEAFYADMGRPPSREYQIERIDNDRGYWPDNCRWASRWDQASNKRNNRYITARGETRTLAEWSRITGLDHKTLAQRVDLGWSGDAAVDTPREVAKRKFMWVTPAGAFETLTAVAEHHGMSINGAHGRFKSFGYPEWRKEKR